MLQGSDAWLLLSLIYARDFVKRDFLYQIGDHINHAIFTDEELNDGMKPLKGGGYAVAKGVVSPQARVYWHGTMPRSPARSGRMCIRTLSGSGSFWVFVNG